MTTSRSQSASNKRRAEVEALKEQLAKLTEQLAQISGNPSGANDAIQQDEYISVMSLIPYNLNLSTKEGGQGTVKKFTHFGEVKKILYRDLLDIMEVHANFLEAGYFYILDHRFIRQHGLDDTYSKILTKDKIEQILSTNSEECVELYKSANEKQQEIIIQLLVEKIRNNPDSVNLNVIDRISRVSKVDIVKRAEEGQQAESGEKSE